MSEKKKVLVAMSGGVDSSAAPRCWCSRAISATEPC